MANKRLRFGIIGCGRISKNHVEALARNRETLELVAVCDVIEERALGAARLYGEALAAQERQAGEAAGFGGGFDKAGNGEIGAGFGGPPPVAVYGDYQKMLLEAGLDCAAICAESGYHARLALDCLDAGLHVLVEKPMALSLDDADAMIGKAAAKGLKLGVCHQNRFNPAVAKLRRALEEGRFGKLINGTARVLWARDEAYYKQAAWRGTWKLDGGALMNQCIHNIDLLQWMLGGEPQSVHGQTGRFIRDIEAEDFGAIVIRFKNGCIGVVEGSVCVYPRNLEETLSLFGETGTAVLGGLAVNEVKTWDFADHRDYDDEREDADIANVYGKGHTPLYRDFAEAVLNGGKPYISGEDGRVALDIILRVYAQEGHVCG
jgi:predicted dehydrogenase